jgi:hypothetical protein
MTPPIRMVYPYTSSENTAKDSAFSASLNSPLIAGVNIAAPLASGSELLMHLTGLTGLPFVLGCSTIGLAGFETFTVPDVARGTVTYPKVWAPSFAPVWQAAMGAMLGVLDTTGLSDACAGVSLLPVQPYIDGEMGYAVQNGTGRNDAAFAAAGWTPSGYKAAVVSCAAWLSGHPVMAGKMLRVALFDPGNWPRVNDAGAVTSAVNSRALSMDLMASIESAYTAGPVMFCDTTFETAPSAFAAALVAGGWPQSRVIYQVQTGLTVDKFAAAVKAMPQDAAAWEIHPPYLPWIAGAVAALTETPFAA